MIMIEALLLAAVGVALGAIAGAWLGQILLRLVTRTINDLYFVLNAQGFMIAPASLIKAGLLGFGATLGAALAPAVEATATPPQAVLARSCLEDRVQRWIGPLALLGLALGAIGAMALLASKALLAGFAGAFAILLGCTFAAPLAVRSLASVTRRLPARLLGGGGRMALQDLMRSMSRTGPAIAALMIAVAAAISVAVMVNSFRGAVGHWLEQSLRADAYIRTPGKGGGPGLSPQVIAALRSMPQVSDLVSFRGVDMIYRGKPARLVAIEPARQTYQGYRLREGRPEQVWRAFEQGAVVVSEPFAYRHELSLGDDIELPTDDGPANFAVAGIYADYGSEHGRMLLHMTTYRQHWRDRAITSAAVYGREGVNADDLVRDLERRLGPLQPLRILPTRKLLKRSLEIFDRTFTITGVLRLLAIIVAFIGVLSALMALQMERSRDYAVLRALGITRPEIAKIVALQTGFMGLATGLISIPVGLMLAWILVFVINRRSFGWTMDFNVEAAILGQSLALALVAALLAGIYPALRTARANPAEALREDL